MDDIWATTKKYLALVTWTLAVVCFSIAFTKACASCKPAATAAEIDYTIQLVKCASDAGSKADDIACRKRVNAQWGVDGGY